MSTLQPPKNNTHSHKKKEQQQQQQHPTTTTQHIWQHLVQREDNNQSGMSYSFRGQDKQGEHEKILRKTRKTGNKDGTLASHQCGPDSG